MKKKNQKAGRGKFLLVLVALCYAFLCIVNIEKGFAALHQSFSVLQKVLPIIAVVILFTSLLNYFLKPKQIAKRLGRKSGASGWAWALLAGVLSHGPMYAWYPLLEDLRRHGMRDGLIVVFFSSRAIKLPLVPMMIDYFGLVFTLVLSVYLLLGSILQGYLFEFIEDRGR